MGDICSGCLRAAAHAFFRAAGRDAKSGFRQA